MRFRFSKGWCSGALSGDNDIDAEGEALRVVFDDMDSADYSAKDIRAGVRAEQRFCARRAVAAASSPFSLPSCGGTLVDAFLDPALPTMRGVGESVDALRAAHMAVASPGAELPSEFGLPPGACLLAMVRADSVRGAQSRLSQPLWKAAHAALMPRLDPATRALVRSAKVYGGAAVWDAVPVAAARGELTIEAPAFVAGPRYWLGLDAFAALPGGRERLPVCGCKVSADLPLSFHYASCNFGNGGLAKHNGLGSSFFSFWRHLGPLQGGRVLDDTEFAPIGGRGDRLDGLISGLAGAHETGVDFVVTDPTRVTARKGGSADTPLVAATQAEGEKVRHWRDLAAYGYGFLPAAFETTGAIGPSVRERVIEPCRRALRRLKVNDRLRVESGLAPMAAFNGRSALSFYVTRMAVAVVRGVGRAICHAGSASTRAASAPVGPPLPPLRPPQLPPGRRPAPAPFPGGPPLATGGRTRALCWVFPQRSRPQRPGCRRAASILDTLSNKPASCVQWLTMSSRRLPSGRLGRVRRRRRR
ncbi:MAG TPA: hypothetical protein RMH80_26410, partial [Polyangiaceae bacterium LLY-WYZ-15_(1-7)]|nr:hypothetical protein [Polyangiaceae bacterium LLY-WYZ-15_(1-7)]